MEEENVLNIQMKIEGISDEIKNVIDTFGPEWGKSRNEMIEIMMLYALTSLVKIDEMLETAAAQESLSARDEICLLAKVTATTLGNLILEHEIRSSTRLLKFSFFREIEKAQKKIVN